MEVLVAVTLGALLALLIHRGLFMVRDFDTRGSNAREQALTSMAVRSEIQSWLRGAFTVPGEQIPVFTGEARADTEGGYHDHLSFLSHLPTGPARVELGVERGNGLVARVESGRRAASSAVEDTLHLVPAATGLEIRYELDLGDSIVWVRDWSSSARLPDLVELRILGDSVPLLLRAPIAVNIGGAD